MAIQAKYYWPFASASGFFISIDVPFYSIMKKLPLIILFAMIGSAASAQNSIDLSKAFSAGLELGAPSHGVYNIGFGGSGKAELPIASPVSLTVTAGYTSFYYKGNLFDSNRTPSAAGYVPLKGGVKYYFSQAVSLEGELGASLETNYEKQNLFAFSLGPSFFIPSDGHNRGFDFGFRYEGWGNQVHQTAFRVAYRLGW